MSATPHPADSHDLIRVQGARENNLRNVSVDIPKRRLTLFTGVSGSGKSSLVFGTIAAESQRMINETYSAFVQGFMPSMARPDVDVLDGLTTAILVDQQRVGAQGQFPGAVTKRGLEIGLFQGLLSVKVRQHLACLLVGRGGRGPGRVAGAFFQRDALGHEGLQLRPEVQAQAARQPQPELLAIGCVHAQQDAVLGGVVARCELIEFHCLDSSQRTSAPGA